MDEKEGRDNPQIDEPTKDELLNQNKTPTKEDGTPDWEATDEQSKERLIEKAKEDRWSRHLNTARVAYATRHEEKGAKATAITAIYQYILARYDILTMSDTKEIHLYNEGVYINGGEVLIEQHIADIGLNGWITKHDMEEILQKIRRETYVKRQNIIEDKNKICLNNGIYDIETGKFSKHDPKVIFFSKIATNYDPLADCQKFKTFIGQCINTEDLPGLQEFVGNCLIKHYKYQKALILYGCGSNGKSTFLEVLTALLGKENCSNVPLQQLNADNHFSTAALCYKLANICDDLPKRKIEDTSYFKMLTGDGSIDAEHKFKDKFTFNNYAKLIFSANEPPYLCDDSEAAFRRWLIIDFPQKFGEDSQNLKPGEKAKNPNLKIELSTIKEMSGILNWAIEGYKRLAKNGRFTNDKDAETIRAEYNRRSSSVIAFIQDCCEENTDSYIPKETLFKAYESYCHKNSITPKNEVVFAKRLKNYLPRVSQSRIRTNGDDKLRIWNGLELLQDQHSLKQYLPGPCSKLPGPEENNSVQNFSKTNIDSGIIQEFVKNGPGGPSNSLFNRECQNEQVVYNSNLPSPPGPLPSEVSSGAFVSGGVFDLDSEMPKVALYEIIASSKVPVHKDQIQSRGICLGLGVGAIDRALEALACDGDIYQPIKDHWLVSKPGSDKRIMED